MGRKPIKALARLGSSTGEIDDMLYRRAVNCCVGEIVKRRESSENARNYLVDTLIVDAIWSRDVELIDKIVHRIDGAVPKDETYGQYANLFGHALDEVLDLPVDDQLTMKPEDNVLIAMAKTVVYVALTVAGNSVQKSKAKHLAVDMVFDRTGGRKTQPRMIETTVKYTKPSWMKLQEGEGTYTVEETKGDDDVREAD